jgi:hypothetical protein
MPSQERMTTDLEAVNTMLACVGESPIESLLGDLTANVQIAVDLLRKTSRGIQAAGYHFNSEEDFELSRATDGTVTLPGNTLDVDLTVEEGQVDLVQRGLKLYDRKNHTYTFSFNPHVDIIFFLAWDELNEPSRQYIMITAARLYQDQTVGSQEHHQFALLDEQKAQIVFEQSDARNEDANIFDSEDMASIVRRRRPRLLNF